MLISCAVSEISSIVLAVIIYHARMEPKKMMIILIDIVIYMYLRLCLHRNIRYTVFAIPYSAFAICYTGTTVHIKVAHAFSVLFS